MKNIPINKSFSLMDIGARDGIGWPWIEMQNDNLVVTLIEPDPVEAELLSNQKNVKVINCALWDKEGHLSLNINNSPAVSSIYSSNMGFLKHFNNPERFELKEKVSVHSKTIDSLVDSGKISSLDFAKIDVQGGELAILSGGENFLKNNVIGLEVEVEFAEVYINQPKFSDIDIFIRKKLGLELWDIRKTYWKYKQDSYKQPLKGRLIFGDALYLRPISTLKNWLSKMSDKKGSEKLSSLIVTTIAYGFLDYTYAILNSPDIKKYLTNEDRIAFANYTKEINKGFYPFNNGNKFLYKIFNTLTNAFKPTHLGWGSSEAHLGSKKKYFFWY
jgi:FkbM family methyltransferase